ncbi:MAG: zinc-dependent alcohol dehydrogenase family protein [Candidatus Marinimicrobia bacterium]|nr:zinc-dependent alcohol dehydrogenase family protein [Candidatus Neomarinimicrobiota bacterium]
MKAMILEQLTKIKVDSEPLVFKHIPDPLPNENELLIKVETCGVCHTELDEIEGRTPPEQLPRILGHQIVGIVIGKGSKPQRFNLGDRIGIAWINSACGVCPHCRAGNENLCSQFSATGRDVDGGYAELATIAEDFAFKIPEFFTPENAAPLLCAGAIGYRSLRLSGLNNGQRIGLTGFGASAHLVLKMVKFLYPDSAVYVFARNVREQEFALGLGAVWSGDTTAVAPEKLAVVIDTTPAWKPVIEALGNLTPGGRLIINAIRKEESDKQYLQQLDYSTHLWQEKEIKSVANVSRRDVSKFLELAARMKLKPAIEEYALEEANQALCELKHQRIRGAKVLRIG